MKQLTRELRIIEKRNEIVKARMEYHGFMRVRELKDIYSSCSLIITMLRLEGNLVSASNSLQRILKRK